VDVLVAAGRGIKKQENLELIRKLAGLFNHSAVAGSRAVIDSGWLPYSAQVGLTGKTVTPKAYIACGISGSPQHIAGMKNSQLIIAINKDANAAIFNYAHYCIVEDLQEFLPVLIEALNRSSLSK
jgi:electron transfer flavoprotein alpha subunit